MSLDASQYWPGCVIVLIPVTVPWLIEKNVAMRKNLNASVRASASDFCDGGGAEASLASLKSSGVLSLSLAGARAADMDRNRLRITRARLIISFGRKCRAECLHRCDAHAHIFPTSQSGPPSFPGYFRYQ